MSDLWILAIAGAWLAFLFAFGCWQWRRQRNDWNDGICAESGKPWRQFDTDSQGGRGYTDGDGNYMWLDWYRPLERA